MNRIVFHIPEGLKLLVVQHDGEGEALSGLGRMLADKASVVNVPPNVQVVIRPYSWEQTE